MSFVLQFFDAPQADSVEKAVEHMDRSGDHDPAAVAKFERFVQLVTLLYPDLSEEDEDGDDDRNIWSEGLSGHERARPFFNVALKTHFVEEGILSIVASKAIMAGLQMLDPQNGMLYRADHVVVDQWGKQSPFRMLTPFAAKAMKPLRGGLNAPQVRQHIGAQLHEAFLKPHGFALTCTDSHAVVWRHPAGHCHPGIQWRRRRRHCAVFVGVVQSTFSRVAGRIACDLCTVEGRGG